MKNISSYKLFNNFNSYHIFMFFMVSVTFFLNINHLSEQGIYQNTYLPLANSLIENLSYTRLNEFSDTYPMWGYPILLSLFQYFGNAESIFFFQYLLTIISLIIYFDICKEFSMNKRILSDIIFFFYTMILSGKWPDAILAFCLMKFAYSHINKNFIIAAIFLGIAYNFRSEALFFLLFYIFYIIITEKNVKTSLALFFICPWILFQFYNHGSFIPTATNSGGVLYISLGQLPNNKWDRIHLDEEAEKFVILQSNGNIIDPWSYQGSQILTNQFKKDIYQHPFEFIKKTVYNTFSILKGGVYRLEPHHIFMDHSQSQFLIKHYRKNKSELIRDSLMFNKNAISITSLIILDIFSKIFFFFLLVYCSYLVYKKYIPITNIFLFLVMIQMSICILIQYQPRHISHIIILFIFMLMNNEISLKTLVKN